jgi:DNA replication protein DnaC
LGFVPFDRAGGELLFHLLADRYEKRSVLVTSNLAFAEWVKVFAGDEKLTTALLDRLAHHATVIATKGRSYRMRKRGTEDPTPPTVPAALPKPARKA